jgi:dTDP-4-amino-4,6-dideoxygalactose transaminase
MTVRRRAAGRDHMKREDFLPYNQPDISDAEIEAVSDVLRSGWLAPGPRVRAFEADFAAYAGVRHAIAIDSATAGMHLALLALGVGPGDEVITTPMTFAATVNVIIHCGATPVLADIGAGDLCVDPAAVERAVTPRTKAILPVHHGGAACDMPALLAIARRHGLRVVEDAAHALDTRIEGRPVGSFGDATVFSFYPTKNVTSARGGMITTNDDALAERCRLLALHGMSNDAWDRYTERGSWAYRVLAAGYNYAMSDFQAALGHAQFARLADFQRRRHELAAIYRERLSAIPALIPPAPRPGTAHAWHLYVLRLRLERLTIDRDRFIVELKERGIGVSVHFIPVHHHPYYRETFGWAPGDFPVADAAFASMISLPLYSRMSDADALRVCDAVAEIVEAYRC